MINIFLAIISIYKLRLSTKKSNLQGEKGAIQNLTLNEKIECVIPLAYCICGFYGLLRA